MNGLEREKLETLDGSRSGSKEAKRRQAVRVVDLAAILEMPDRLQSAAAAGSTPTAAEFDALQADVAALHRRLAALSDAIAAKLR